MTYWPKNVIIWGAGATAALGMPVSDRQSGFVSAIRNGQDIAKEFGVDISRDEDPKINLLKDILQLVPLSGKDKISIQDTLNLFAIFLKNQRSLSIYCSAGSKQKELSPGEVEKSYLFLCQLMVRYFQNQYCELLKSKRAIYQQYHDIYLTLAEDALTKKASDFSECNLRKREYYLLDYAFVNFNWDILLLWAIFTVHKRLNDEKSNYIGCPAQKLKIFNDFGVFLGTKPIEKKENLPIWYPYNETVLQRINDPQHISDRRILLGKFYQPHGSFNWKECSHCGKLNMWLGEEWELLSTTLFDVNKLSECLFCGSALPPESEVRLIQTPFKDTPPPYIEEIQREMFLAIENAEHLIFAGYSLPEDDLIYRSIMAARHSKNKLKVTVLGYGNAHGGVPSSWLSLAETSHEISHRIAKVLGFQTDRSVFRINLEGIPDVFLKNRKVDKDKVLDVFTFK